MSITASLQVKRGIYQVVLRYKDNLNHWKQKWISLHIEEKGNNKRLANQKLDEIKQNYLQYLPQTISLSTEETNMIDKYFEVFMRDWLNVHRAEIEENTYDAYEFHVRRIEEYFKGKKIKIKDLKPLHIQNFYNYLYSTYKVSSNSVLKYHANIRCALESLVKLEILPGNPADRIERPKKAQFISEYYTLNEINTLLQLIKGDPLELIVLVTSFYGLRRSEVLGLKWSAFDFEENKITIKHKVIRTKAKGKKEIILYKNKTKNKASHRVLPLTPELKEKLLDHKKQIQENMKLCGRSYNYDFKDYVFVDAIGRLIRLEYITDHFKLFMEWHKDELKRIRFHDLRHSCASLLLSRGISMKAIQHWLGHSTYTTTANLYAHLEDNYNELSADALAKVISF